MVNVHSQKDLYQANLNACYLAASEGFPHLSIAEIIEPPHGMMDAFLVRQIVMHMMVTQFCWPKKRLWIEEQRNRHALYHGLKVIDERLTSAKFEAHYRTIAYRALELLAAHIREAA
jgi:hypothetical protein